jgi:hypothetical protein
MKNIVNRTTTSLVRWTASALVLAAVTAFADTDDATVKIYGKIPARLAITSSQDKELTEEQLLNGVTDLPATTITEYCNFLQGYTVTVSTKNFDGKLPFLKGDTTGNTSHVVYDIKYKGEKVKWDSGTAQVTDSDRPTPRAGVKKDITVTVVGGQELIADAYSDVLTLTIANK